MRYLTRSILTLLTASFCASTHAAKPIKLGMIKGLSGSFANAGSAVVRNIQLAIENVNAGHRTRSDMIFY